MLNTPHSEQSDPVQLFTHPSFGTIRTAGSADNPLICLLDLCSALGIKNARNVRNRLDKDDVHVMDAIDKLGRTQHVTFVTESGMWDTIIRSDSPKTKSFRKWVTSVVLPSIRKTGHYGVDTNNHPAQVSLDEFKKSLVTTMQELVIKTVAETLKTHMPAPDLPAVSPAVTPQENKDGYKLSSIAKELGTHSIAIVNLLVSIRLLKRYHNEVIPACKVPSVYFLNLPQDVYFPENIRVTEEGRKEILDCFPTYKKQHPYL